MQPSCVRAYIYIGVGVCVCVCVCASVRVVLLPICVLSCHGRKMRPSMTLNIVWFNSLKITHLKIHSNPFARGFRDVEKRK